MMTTDSGADRKGAVSPKQIARNVRAMVVALAIFCFSLGANLANLARTITQHNSFQVAPIVVFGLISLAVAVAVVGTVVHVLLRRLAQTAELA
jgi:hypothetical protein